MTNAELLALLREARDVVDMSLPVYANSKLVARIDAALAEVERLHALVRQNGGSVHESVEGFMERMRRERDNAIEQNGRAATVAIRERDAAFKRGAATMREAAAKELDRLLTERKATAIWAGPDELRALPDPKDKP